MSKTKVTMPDGKLMGGVKHTQEKMAALKAKANEIAKKKAGGLGKLIKGK